MLDKLKELTKLRNDMLFCLLDNQYSIMKYLQSESLKSRPINKTSYNIFEKRLYDTDTMKNRYRKYLNNRRKEKE